MPFVPTPTTLETYAAHQAALNLFHRYQIVGGMPAAVNAYRKTLSIEDARVEPSAKSTETYTADMTDPENGISGVAARKVWRSIPSQLLRSSTKKFKYSEVERGGRRSKLIEPLDWLEGAGIISVNNLTEGIEPPLVPFDDEDGSFFKVYLLDTGLMFYKLGISPRLWLDLKEDSAIALSSDFRGALAENSVMQAFSGNGLQTYYWMPPSSWKTNGELDFLLQTDRMEIVPVEVKSARNVRARTLGSFMKNARSPYAYILSRTILPAAKPMTDASCAISPCTQRALSEQTASRAVCNPARPPRKEPSYAARTVYLPREYLSLDDGRVGVYRACAPRWARGGVCHRFRRDFDRGDRQPATPRHRCQAARSRDSRRRASRTSGASRGVWRLESHCLYGC